MESTEQEARILYEIFSDGMSFAPNYIDCSEEEKTGWRRLAELVLVDKKEKEEISFLVEDENGNLATRIFNHTVPESLDDAKFLTAWGSWLDDRKERKKKVTARAAKIQLKKLETMGVQRAIAAIENSIEKGYQGIFEPTGNKYQRTEEENPNKIDF